MRALLLALALIGCNDRPTRRDNAPPASLAPIDLNTATEHQLESLPGIGPKHASSIVHSRAARGGRFKSVDELLQIDGIGPRTVDQIRPYVVVR